MFSRKVSVFGLVLFGQMVSAFGSGLSFFALGVWVYQSTGSATRFALVVFFASAPAVLLSPVAGTLVDRFNRRWVMILSDTCAAVPTLVIVLLLRADALALWYLYVAVGLGALASTFQGPAFIAATTLLVPKEHYARANGAAQAGYALAGVLAPLSAGMLLVKIGLSGVILIDFATFVFAVSTLFFVHIPQPPRTEEGEAARGSFVAETLYGWTYIRQRAGLFSMLILLAVFNFCMGTIQVILTPLVLSFADAEALGVVLSIAVSGIVVGGILMVVWGGPKRRMTGVYLALTLQGLILFAGGLRASVALIATAAFFFMFGIPIINSCIQAIWQSKVAPDVQGRVFAMRSLIVMASTPLGYLSGGPLIDYVFEPLLAAGGPLAASVGAVIGTGSGRGAALLFITLGCVILLSVLLGYRYSPMRNVEDELPDAIDDTPSDGDEPDAGS